MFFAFFFFQELLCGELPFYGENETIVYKKIMKGKYDFKSSTWDRISPCAKDLVGKLLTGDPHQRFSYSDIR